VVRGHKNITTAVSFSISSLLCICVEIQGQEGLALDLVSVRISRTSGLTYVSEALIFKIFQLPLLTIKLLNELEIPLGIFIVLDQGTIIYSSSGEKQRNLLKDQFLEGALNPIFVAYNI